MLCDEESSVKNLYRGVNPDLYEKLKGKLLPKKVGEEFASFACAGDPHALCGAGIQAGKSDLNSVILHQWDQAGIPTSGISTSSDIDRAKVYALNKGEYNKGYIFKLSIEKLVSNGVKIYRVNDLVPDPAVPEDDEHVIVSDDFGSIPDCAILEVIEIGHTLSR